MKLPVAILAGGQATRLRPITANLPKALVIVAGKPFIFWQLEYIRAQGGRKIVLCIGHLGDMIRLAVGDGSRFGLKITYASDGDAPLGTGGALLRALPMLPENFFVLYGDSYLPVDFTQIETAFHAAKKPGLMTVMKNSDRWDKSNVWFEDNVLLKYNKMVAHPEMQHIDYGLSILCRDAILAYGIERFDLAELLHALSLRGDLAGYEVQERFYEIGSHSGLRETEDYLLEKLGRP